MKYENVDDYIAAHPAEVRDLLQRVRETIRKAAPEAEELISYSMPAFKLGGMLVWYGAHTKHIGFYPRASGMDVFKDELSKYKVSKGAVQFPFDKPLPVGLIGKMVKYRVLENMKEAEAKGKKKK